MSLSYRKLLFNLCFNNAFRLLILISIATFNHLALAANYSPLLKPLPALSASQLGVIVNDNDPLSIRIADYYQYTRKIPYENIIHIRFNPGYSTLPVNKFHQIKQQIDKLTPKHIQAFALTWMQPYRVGCMSITTAFTAGYDEAFCAQGCKSTRQSPYFNKPSQKPYSDFEWRPTMMLAGESFAEVKALIDRGIKADYSHPKGTAYLLKTDDKSRSVRNVFFPAINQVFSELWPVQVLEQNFISHQTDVMFYFTGKTHIKNIETNQFLPGAVADHLTSTGGVLTGGSQMSILNWLKAGATGSYGTVVEPCNFLQKFPNPGILMQNYIRGSSLIEAYWKSVAWPGQGIFIGEPLAKPFAYPEQATVK
jgi:uncharacterized protein (TIGR03790 family)